MDNLVVLEEFKTFSDASRCAREFAMQHKRQIGVRRGAAAWEVLVPSDLVVSASEDEEEFYDPFDISHDEDERDQIFTEMDGDREDWARSEDDGWYYSDAD